MPSKTFGVLLSLVITAMSVAGAHRRSALGSFHHVSDGNPPSQVSPTVLSQTGNGAAATVGQTGIEQGRRYSGRLARTRRRTQHERRPAAQPRGHFGQDFVDR